MTRDDPARAQRLADALRQNLRRRKAQARALQDGPREAGATTAEAPSDEAPVSLPAEPSRR